MWVLLVKCVGIKLVGEVGNFGWVNTHAHTHTHTHTHAYTKGMRGREAQQVAVVFAASTTYGRVKSMSKHVFMIIYLI